MNKRPEGALLDDPRGDSVEYASLREKRFAAVAARPGRNYVNMLEAADTGRDNEGHFRPTDPEPTDARQGTRAKLDVMAARVASGEELWHDDDGGHEEDDDSLGSGDGTVSCRRGGRTVRDV